VASEGADSATFVDVVFLRNRAPSGSGGAVYLDANEDQSFLRVLFHANLADEAGGGVCEEDSSGESTFENSIFTENIGGTGGGFYRKDAGFQASLVNNTFAGNDGSTAGAHLYMDDSTVSFVNNIAWSGQDGGGLYASDSSSALGSDFYYNDVGNNSGGDYTGTLVDPVTSGNISLDPLFRDYTIDGDEENDDLYLTLASPCVNTGDPSIVDVDGTRSDMGAFGGPNADADDGDSDGHYDLTDCNDSDPAIHPGATEIPYDGVDQDCDGVDLTDADGDGFEGSEVGGEDCDDSDEDVYPGAAEVWYDGVDQDCDEGSDYDADADGFDWDLHGGLDCDDTDPAYRPGVTDTVGDGEDQNCDGVDGTDADGDGFASLGSGGTDCDDGDASVWPGATEVPYDGIDQDCDGSDLNDVDGDGFDAEVTGGLDCDDTDPDVYPGATEVWYDGIDEDCDGLSDYDADVDGYDATAGGGDDCDDADPSVHPGATETWYDGIDADCDGLSDYDADGDLRDAEAHGGDDCNDTDAEIHPAASEVPYDGIDQDCDGDDLTDVDFDGYDAVEAGGIDCDDTDPTIHPEALDAWYDGVDSNCDGADDYDQDADGYTSDAYGGDDCDDTDGEVNPGRDAADDEWYDGIDTDCDGSDDYDQDGDGVRARGYGGDDCDDTNPNTYPGAEEIKDGLDNDCDGLDEMADQDEDGVADWYEWLHGTQYLNPDTDGDGWTDGEEFGVDPESPLDTDGDGVINALDTDDDGDRIPTQREQNEDINSDGLPDRDVDGDGIENGLDLDSDGDGLKDKQEGAVDRDADGVPDYLDYQGDFLGGGCTGCSTGGNGGGALWFALVALAAAFRRRAAGLVAAAGIATPAAAQSFQSPPIDAHGFWVADTAGAPQRSVRLVYPGSGDGWDVGFLTDLAHNPLRETRTDGKSRVLVDTLTTSHVYGAYDWNSLRFDASYPFTVYGHDQVGGFVASGDLRLGAMYPFLPSKGGWPALGIQALAWAPTGSGTRWSGSPGFAGGAVFSVAQHIDRFGYTLNLGARLGQQKTARNVTSGSGPIGGLDLNYLLPILDDGLGVGADVVIQGASGFQTFPVEPGVHVRGRLKSGAFAVLGASTGMGAAIGGSQWRGYLGIGYGGLPESPEVVKDKGTVVVPVIVERIERASKDGPLAVLVEDRIVVREQVFFREAMAEIIPASDPVLDAVRKVLVAHPEIKHLLVAGHTNSNGTRAHNRALSQARAEAVCAWLELNGIAADRLIPKGYGEEHPLVKDSHPDAMVINRRVDFMVLRSDGSGEAPAVPDVKQLPKEVQQDRMRVPEEE
jgi:MYXO-CTERM domain-containing protein